MSNSYGIIMSIMENRAISTEVENDNFDEYIKDARPLDMPYINATCIREDDVVINQMRCVAKVHNHEAKYSRECKACRHFSIRFFKTCWQLYCSLNATNKLDSSGSK